MKAELVTSNKPIQRLIGTSMLKNSIKIVAGVTILILLLGISSPLLKSSFAEYSYYEKAVNDAEAKFNATVDDAVSAYQKARSNAINDADRMKAKQDLDKTITDATHTKEKEISQAKEEYEKLHSSTNSQQHMEEKSYALKTLRSNYIQAVKEAQASYNDDIAKAQGDEKAIGEAKTSFNNKILSAQREYYDAKNRL